MEHFSAPRASNPPTGESAVLRLEPAPPRHGTIHPFEDDRRWNHNDRQLVSRRVAGVVGSVWVCALAWRPELLISRQVRRSESSEGGAASVEPQFSVHDLDREVETTMG